MLFRTMAAISEIRSSDGSAMIVRLGNVLYWFGCGVAVLILVIGVLQLITEGSTRSGEIWIVIGFIIAALIVWLIGRSCRYVLSGK
jgi:hypothetical protein